LFVQNQFFSSAIADPCINFDKAVIEEYEPIFPFEEKDDLGIFFNYEWDENIQKIIIKRNKKFPIIKFSLFEKKLHPGAVVKIFNGEDLSKMDDEDIRRLVENSESAEIQYFYENKINMIEVSSKKYDSLIFILKDFVLNSINDIEAKEGFFAIDHKTSFYYKRTDLKKEGESLLADNCLISDVIIDKRLFYPEDFLTLINFETDQDKITKNKYFSYYADSTWLDVISEGLAKIRVKFAFKKFPFDTQVLKIQYQTNNLRSGEEATITPTSSADYQFISIIPTEQVFISLNNYMNDNYLQEWKVKSTKVSSEFVASDNFYFDEITLALEIKRKWGYYLYKIIIPILLILAVAWYVLWIPTEDVEARLTTSIVAFLSLIAFNFVFQDDIPKLDILTSLDKFILLSYLFCAIPIFTTIRLSKAIEKSKKRASHLNKLIRSVGLVIYIFGSLTIFYPVL
jgi:hypothetical protein